MSRFISLLFLAVALRGEPSGPAPEGGHRLFRNPAISKTQIVFEYANDLWIVSREGGDARRLTAGVGRERYPRFSPDGSQIAFAGEYDGNIDVYLVPAAGGTPRRVTYHPGADIPVGWTPDGTKILFNSSRQSFADSNLLYTIAAAAGAPGSTLPSALPLAMAEGGCYSPDGTHIAYQPIFHWQDAWKRYKGGQTLKIWIANLADSSVVPVPRVDSNDFDPMWVGNMIYFLSDRSGPISLWSYDTRTKKVSEVVKNSGLDFKSASASGDAIAIEQFGAIRVFDLKSGKVHPVQINVAADLTEVRARYQKITNPMIANAGISPTGQRAVIEAHGEILTVPAEKGDVRNLTATPSIADRDPAWSNDGKSVAYFSDELGEYALHIRAQDGLGVVTKISLGAQPSYFYSPLWSPDNKKIVYFDKRLNLWYVDLDKKTPVRIDTDRYDSPSFDFRPNWSPDSKWLAYAKQLPNHLHGIFAYSLASGQVSPLTDGLSDSYAPAFDKTGKYLFFLASTNVGLGNGWIDMTSIGRPQTSAVYVMVLRKDLPSPLAPQSDDENAAADGKKDGDAKKDAAVQAAAVPATAGKDKAPTKPEGGEAPPPEVKIDLEKLGQRILAVPLPEKNYYAVDPGKEGIIYVVERPVVSLGPGPEQLIVNKFDFKTRKTDLIVGGVSSYTLSANAEKMLFRQGEQWFITGADAPPKPGDGLLKMSDVEVYVDPKAEWEQMYREVWRIERDFFYDPHFHGLDLKAAETFYAPWVKELSSRSDLNYLFVEMLGNINVGHMFVGGGESPEVPRLKVGLLGADYSIENGRYRFSRVYDGENWNPGLQAPLTQPGVGVQAGEYLLAVQGRELTAADNVYSYFVETAGKQISLRVGPNPDGSSAREVIVVPVENEAALRHLDWIEGNRRKVDQLSGGKLAYVHLPDTGLGGYTSFNRYFFAQIQKQGAILDERYNHGGSIADYIIEYLNRRPLGRIASRDGEDVTDPTEAIYGPKVMIINQFAGSGGDAMPWYFRKIGLGPLVGTKTWGGLVGIGNYPQLMDGGSVTAPRWAFYGLTGEWEVENHGISPDVEVEQDPQAVRAGHDPQLEKAVDVALGMLKKNPPTDFKRPSYPDYHPHFEQ